MNETVLQAIVAFIFGHKYYVNIVNTRGTTRCETTSFIWSTKQQAMEHKMRLEDNRSFRYVETVSFRSREVYKPAVSVNE